MSSTEIKEGGSPTTATNGMQQPTNSFDKVNGVVGTCNRRRVCDTESLTVNMKQRIRTFAPMCTSYFCFYAGVCVQCVHNFLSIEHLH